MTEDSIDKLRESKKQKAKIQDELTRWAQAFRDIADLMEGKEGQKRNKHLLGHEDKLLLDGVHGEVHFNYDALPKSEELIKLLDMRDELHKVIENIKRMFDAASKGR